MPLTTVVGSSGAGKTTFMQDVHKSHRCVYVRQYHSLRPYIPVAAIPDFDETELPFWNIYKQEGTAETIKVGGTMAGAFTAGLSGGQRKLFVFELIYQRTKRQRDLLICLDEPFAGVTDDYVPWVVDRLNLMRRHHNILLVTNDHVQALTGMSDNTITVSAVDRSVVTVNNNERVDREKAIMALSVGEAYAYEASGADYNFFVDAEMKKNASVMGVATYAICAFALFIPTFWGTAQEGAALVLIAIDMIGYFAIKPYLLSLVDWRNYVSEEAEALMHSSKGKQKLWKTYLTMCMILLISLLQYGLANAVIDGLGDFTYWIAIFFDSGSLTFPSICLGLYTSLPLEAVASISSLPFMLLIFFSTTYSPGSGIAVVKEFRYLFSRFYLWCMTPGVSHLMEGCPASRSLNVLYLVLTGSLGVIIFLVCMLVKNTRLNMKRDRKEKKRKSMAQDAEFQSLQLELYGVGQHASSKELLTEERQSSFSESGGKSMFASNDNSFSISSCDDSGVICFEV
ncbi:expressed unknown protein [Seminavis robusta]|uniref:Uncharacterized protein n=1 Tax=Seminavis robusta TaxID=568900 RepID=A0A9N8HES0_9STRA|nr:expressed unknown protein [Seminavis robusta]|eukprot:Sro423_g139750.1 n/a (512) ;mRNA; r:13109-14908